MSNKTNQIRHEKNDAIKGKLKNVLFVATVQAKIPTESLLFGG
jgi:hypothetical protein